MFKTGAPSDGRLSTIIREQFVYDPSRPMLYRPIDPEVDSRREMYVVCLDVNQEEYPGMWWPYRMLYQWWEKSDIWHVEVAFTDKGDLLSFSTDISNNGVFHSKNKTYNRTWWRFYRIENLSQMQINAALAFCYAKVREKAGFNELGANCVLFGGWSGQGKEFFCSELVAWCLIIVGALPPMPPTIPERMTPADINRIVTDPKNSALFKPWSNCGTVYGKKIFHNLLNDVKDI
jgi:hypothetical protein